MRSNFLPSFRFFSKLYQSSQQSKYISAAFIPRVVSAGIALNEDTTWVQEMESAGQMEPCLLTVIPAEPNYFSVFTANFFIGHVD